MKILTWPRAFDQTQSRIIGLQNNPDNDSIKRASSITLKNKATHPHIQGTTVLKRLSHNSPVWLGEVGHNWIHTLEDGSSRWRKMKVNADKDSLVQIQVKIKMLAKPLNNH